MVAVVDIETRIPTLLWLSKERSPLIQIDSAFDEVVLA